MPRIQYYLDLIEMGNVTTLLKNTLEAFFKHAGSKIRSNLHFWSI